MEREALGESHSGDGNTTLDEDEVDGLIPAHLQTRAELNQWEGKNIELAIDWIAGRTLDVLDIAILKELHRRMFGQTWEWAGKYRKTMKTVSPFSAPEVPRLMVDLINNTKAQYEACNGDGDELDRTAARFHHELVRIHPWPNGNGRHGRMATDLLLKMWKRAPFSWGAMSEDTEPAITRARYLKALVRADANEYAELYEFVRS
ncbi:MAG: mobile mystery protein B [Gemmatimonadaceae bacterium]|nr:mobile mystery protein B [Gemmatimonadaceae bacterium]